MSACASRNRIRSQEKGIALLLVITVLVTLVIVAVPFALSMRQGHERTTSELAKGRADFEASLLVEAMKHALGNTHPMMEEERWLAGERGLDADSRVDSLEEIALGDDFRRRLEESWEQALSQDFSGASDSLLAAHLQALRARGLGLMNDDRGSIWTGVVEDANGKVNPNGASPFLLGNLLGCALLSEELDPSATDIPVEYVVGQRAPKLADFPKDGGFLRIGGETVRYGSFDGSVFRSCERGALPETPLRDNGTAQSHGRGTPVIDYTAYKIATHLIAARPGFLTYFNNLEDLRSIAAWGAGPGLPAERLDVIRPCVSVWSRRETATGWLASQVVVNQLPVSADPTTPDELELRDQFNPTGTTAYTNPGTLLRITDGLNTAYQMVDHVGDQAGGQRLRVVSLAGRVDAGYEDGDLTMEGGETEASAFAPYPININTASQEIIYACMANLHLLGADSPENIVTPEVAWLVAERIVDERSKPLQVDADTNRRQEGPFRSQEDYGRFLERLQEEGMISRTQQSALYYNAVNPHDSSLAFGTVPWCFRTLDVYHVEARVAVNDRGGEQAATAVRREVVEIGSDGTTSWTLDSQDDFEQRLSMGSGAKWTATYPRGVNFRNRITAHIQPALRARKGVAFGVYPSPERSEQEERGEVRLEPARIRLPGAVLANHFDSSLFTEGWRTDVSGAYTLPVQGVLRRRDEPYGDAFGLSFWWKSYSDANWTAFDCGMEKFLNRYAIFVTEGEEGQELVFRVCASPLEKRGAEIYVPLERIGYAPDTWYHIQVSCVGEDPARMEMLVDGVSVGKRRGLTWLTGTLMEEQQEIPVEDSEGFAQVGALLIGTEVVEYDIRSADSFGDCMRGARGTEPRSWPTGTPVRELGYSLPLLLDIFRGGSRLETELGRWTAIRVNLEPVGGLADETLLTDNSVDPPTITTFFGVNSPEDDSDRESFDAQIVPLWGQTDEEAADAFSTKGIALLGSRNVGFDRDDNERRLHGWEFVYYERDESDATLIHIESRHLVRAGRPEWPDGESYFLTMWYQEPGGEPIEVPAFLVPISIPGSDPGNPGEDYLDPSDLTHEELLTRYGGDGSARVLVGLPTNSEPAEVIIYDAIERDLGSPEILFVKDRYLGTLTVNFFNKGDPWTGEEEEDPYVPPDTGIPEDLGEEEGREAEEVEERLVDVLPPGDTLAPDEDPETDSSGGGEPENAEEDEAYTEEIIPAVREPVDTADLAPPDDGGGSEHGEPAWDDVWPWIHSSFRGAHGTLDRLHDDTSGEQRANLILPCFRIYEGPTESGSYTGRPLTEQGALPVGRNDLITLTDGQEDDPVRLEARIRWGDPSSTWAALDDFLDSRFTAEEEEAAQFRIDPRGHPRVLKFPCGELPDELPREMEFAQSTISDSEVVTAYLDELFAFRHRPAPTFTLEPFDGDTEGVRGLDAGETEIRLIPRPPGGVVDTNSGYDEDCGLLALDGELIVWRGLRREQTDSGTGIMVLERCERGVLGTTPRFHGEGAFGRLVPHIPVSYLDGRVNRDASALPLAGMRGWPRKGLVRILGSDSAELIHFSRRSDEDLILPESSDADENLRGRGLLRGRFGTDALDHDAEAIVFWQPFRYWDRYLSRRTGDEGGFAGVYDHPEGSYVEFGKRARTGYWQRVTWQEGPYDALTDHAGSRSEQGGGESSGFLDLVVLARFSPSIPWDGNNAVDLRGQPELGRVVSIGEERPSDRIYVFDDPEAENRIGIESGTAEFRVFFVYRPGAFLAQDAESDPGAFDEMVFENSWKRTPSLMSLTLEYTSRTSTLNQSVRD